MPRAAPSPVSATEDADTCEVTLTFEDNRSASVVLGQYDQNLAKLERALGVVAHANGNHVTLKGESGACEQARRVLELLYSRAAS
ncbi:MAG: phosphate starvation-inducible protein PhoH, partial [Methylobacteriaceae bacterium]|nr:phosphate starvation-inducible protein PhoH [Methylobacteriaceae bacterium]